MTKVAVQMRLKSRMYNHLNEGDFGKMTKREELITSIKVITTRAITEIARNYDNNDNMTSNNKMIEIMLMVIKMVMMIVTITTAIKIIKII